MSQRVKQSQNVVVKVNVAEAKPKRRPRRSRAARRGPPQPSLGINLFNNFMTTDSLGNEIQVRNGMPVQSAMRRSYLSPQPVHLGTSPPQSVRSETMSQLRTPEGGGEGMTDPNAMSPPQSLVRGQDMSEVTKSGLGTQSPASYGGVGRATRGGDRKGTARRSLFGRR